MRTKLSPYLRLMRLHQPVGIWLLLWPCWWGVAAAGGGLSGTRQLTLMLLFAFGAAIMRSSGCIINDILDRRFDRHVARTSTRPLASGELSLKQGLALLAGLLGLGVLILIQFNRLTILLGIASLALVATYPLMKRITYWPQAFLGLTFNWGVLMGMAAVLETLPPAGFALYAAGVFWTLAYDTIYAYQDIEDDVRIGVKSTAIRFGESGKRWVGLFFSLSIALHVVAGWLNHQPVMFYFWLLPPAILFCWQSITLDYTPQNALQRFKINIAAGGLLWWAWLVAV